MRIALLASVLLAGAAYAAQQPEPAPAVAGGDYVDIELPAGPALNEQWIVVVQGEKIEILPAAANHDTDGTALSGKTARISGEKLTSALAITTDGAVIATPLRKNR